MVRPRLQISAPAALALATLATLSACSLLLPTTPRPERSDGDGDADADGGDATPEDADMDEDTGGDDADVLRDAEADRDEPEEADVDGDEDRDGGDADLPWRGPIVRHEFSDFVAGGDTLADSSGVAPQVDLVARDQEPLGVSLAGGIAEIDGGFLLANRSGSEALSDAILSSGAFSVAVWFEATDGSQDGPARIVTFSQSPYVRAFTIGQDAGALIARVRCTGTDGNGQVHEGEAVRQVHSIDSVFPTAGLVHVALVWEGLTGESRLYLDGVLLGTTPLFDPSGGAATLDWGLSYNRLGVGDEFVEGRPWIGSIADLAIYDRALTETEVAELFGRGP